MAGHNRVDLSGQRFGQLAVLHYSHTSKTRKAWWVCICACGNTAVVQGMRLRSGHTSSCGCLKGHSEGSRRKVHGAVGTPTYKSWDSAKQRCFNPNDDHFARYGGAGITMCERWRQSFPAFLKDMGERPEGTTLDRYPDPLGDYKPGNCRWATPKQQSNNRSSNRLVNVAGEAFTVAEAIDYFRSPNPQAVYDRLRAGWGSEAAVLAAPGTTEDVFHALSVANRCPL